MSQLHCKARDMLLVSTIEHSRRMNAKGSSPRKKEVEDYEMASNASRRKKE